MCRRKQTRRVLVSAISSHSFHRIVECQLISCEGIYVNLLMKQRLH